MDWNAKSPLSRWEWDHLSFFKTKLAETPKLSSPNWMIELDRENNVGLFDTPGGSGCSGSRSSKSASTSPSSIRDSKACKFAFESSQNDSNGKIGLSREDSIKNSCAPKHSSVSGESLLTLRLGKRMYLEDVCPESDSVNLHFSRDFMSSVSVGKKHKSNGQNLKYSCCQVEGCGLDLSSAKGYYRNHKVCESHSKSPKVVVAGLESRFCQQCSRFHDLPEFDEEKRSCRRRLSHHNARRRKVRVPKAVQSSKSAITSARCDGEQHMSPFTNSRTATNLACKNKNKLPQTEDFLLKPAQDSIDTPSNVTTLSDDSNAHFTSKILATKSTSPGVEDFITFPDANATQDFTCALSLLSINPWDSYPTKSFSLEHSNSSTYTAQAITHAMSLRMPLASSESWHDDHDQHVNSSMWISNSNCEDGNHFQEFKPFRGPYESGFHHQLG